MSRQKSEPLDMSKYPPQMTPQAMENQLVAMAYESARNRIANGTASAQEIVYFLKLGSPRSKFELANLEAQNRLLEAKTESIETEKNVEVLYNDVVKAMRVYSGEASLDDENL